MTEPFGTELPRAEERYQIAGEGKELFTRTDLRNRIRSGDLLMSTEIAIEGTDDYRAAAEFPELARYFSLVASAPAVASGSTLVSPTAEAPTGSLVARLVPALAYPITGAGAIIIVVLAFLEAVPFGSVITALVTPLLLVAIVRVSAEGSTRMPAAAAFGGAGSIVSDMLKAFVLSLLAAWPIILAILLIFVMPRAAFSLMIAAFVAMVLYYPACIAILAKYGTIRPALSVSQIWGFITTLEGDYVLALAYYIPFFGLAVALGIAGSGLPSGAQEFLIAVPIVWGAFSVFHLIGWSMHRHRGAL